MNKLKYALVPELNVLSQIETLKTSIFQPSYVSVSCLYQSYDLALKSPKITIKYGFLLGILSKLRSTLSGNFSKTSGDWLCQRYQKIKLHNVPPIVYLTLPPYIRNKP